ncbi:hypothetical protein ABGB08_24845, partial [Acrocarpospora sp. B8E8]
GFNASWNNSSNPAPASFALNGTVCTGTVPSPTPPPNPTPTPGANTMAHPATRRSTSRTRTGNTLNIPTANNHPAQTTRIIPSHPQQPEPKPPSPPSGG